jgi:hypothetical protein
MKTLNHFSDDSLNRATIEMPDVDGNQTRGPAVARKFAEGFCSETLEHQRITPHEVTRFEEETLIQVEKERLRQEQGLAN